MRPFPKELFSRIPAKAVQHAGMFTLLAGKDVLHFGFTAEGETIKSCVDCALDEGILITNPVTGACTLVDSDLITNVGFVVSRPTCSAKLPVKDANGQINRIAHAKVSRPAPRRHLDFDSRNN